ncbi:hypothetical protein CSC14_0710 [Proteus mirabilis]|nr:hypothetical protein CSC14_0710 [Proteus mirabilis]
MSGYTRCPPAEGARLHHSSGRVAGRCGRSPSPSGCPPHRSDQPVCRTRWPSCRCFPPAAAPLWRWHSRPATTPVRTALCFSSHISSFS